MEHLAPPAADRIYTEAEYLALEEASDIKHEFCRGRMIAMAGGTHEHAIIAGNVATAMNVRLGKTPCVTAGSDVRVRLATSGHYRYPDLTVVCEAPLYHQRNRRTTLVNPQVIVEVLSPSTVLTDLGDKLEEYTSIESVREYVAVAQDRAWARSFTRGPDGQRGFGPLIEGLDATLAFRSLDVEVPLAEVYAKVRFPEPGTADD